MFTIIKYKKLEARLGHCNKIQETWGWILVTVMKYKKLDVGLGLLLWKTRHLRLDLVYCYAMQETWGWTWFTVMKSKTLEVGVGLLQWSKRNLRLDLVNAIWVPMIRLKRFAYKGEIPRCRWLHRNASIKFRNWICLLQRQFSLTFLAYS